MESNNGKYTAKKANIFIELHNFSFRHNMFQTNTDDFIGRKFIRNRLKAILYNTKAHSGTYLITGNRGVGKTSLVNKVLSELSPAKRMASGMIRFLTLLFYTLLSSVFMKIFNLYDYKEKLLWSEVIIILSLLVYIFYYSSLRKKPASSNKTMINILHGIFIILSELIILSQKTNRAGRAFQFAKIVIWTTVFQLIYITNTFNNNIPSILLAPPSLCILLGCFLWIINWISNVHNTLSKADKHENSHYRELISNSIATSYAIATCIVTTFLVGITLFISVIFFYDNYNFYILFTIFIPLFFILYLFIKLKFIKKKTDSSISINDIYKICKQLSTNAIGEHISLKNWINQPRQVFVKINLGYEELKSIDILRLISHNLTIEYRKYIYSGSFYWLRTFLVIFTCLSCTLFFTRFITYDFNLIFHGVTTNENFIATIKSIYIFFNNLYEQIYIGISYVIAFIVRLFDNSNLYYKNLPINNHEKPIFCFTKFIFFLFLIFIYKMTAYIPLLKHHIRAPFLNLRHLMQLQDSIAADIKTEDSIKGENKIMDILKIGINKKIEKNYPMLDAHDIEKQLIDIMENISEGWLFQHPQFIIIFDELDKIESEEIKKEKMSKTDSFSPDTIRLRQEAIFELLSGLKYILSTMPAKFIFVAGREMYEASLADASDRSHYLSSIFDDVINVPSFMSDFSDDKSFNICSMTEQYVCRLLFPSGHIVKEYSLKEYGKYLLEKDEEFINKEFYRKRANEEIKNELALERAYQREELLMHLNNFIMYLTYAGKGAPKKMISLFDKYVVKLQPYDLSEMEFKYQKGITIKPLLVRYYKNTIYYLKFDFYEQYTLGLMARMITPVVYRFSHRNIHQYGDKLLVSTLFFMDHLFKFHSHSFSWRSLASSPELIDVNKAPELRNHIADILHFLTQNDLKTISNGLYDFRFFKVIAQEISFMTRVSEISSATFDFSLDESLAVKQYYERRLVNQRNAYESDHIKTENTIFELADQHFTLGELYLYDEDLDNAIVEFDAAISIIQTLKPIDMTSETILALIKNMLSLGIAYEKQNLNDQAFLIYSEVVKLIIASRNTDIGKLGLRTYEGVDQKMKVEKESNQSSKKEPAIYFHNNTQNPTSLMELLDKIPHLHPDIHMVISKITVYDGLQLMYLPLLAKFQILEKSQIGGIQKEDVRRLLKEFYFLSNMIAKGNKALICASFYLKLGNILYYKNAHLIQDSSMLRKDIFPFEVCHDCSEKHCKYYSNTGKVECKFSNRDEFWGENVKTDALHFYIHSLFLIANNTNYTVCYSMKYFINELSKLKDTGFNGWDDNRFNMFGKVLSCIGDVFMSELESTNADNKILKDFLKEYFNERENTKVNSGESNTKDSSTLITLNRLINQDKNTSNKENKNNDTPNNTSNIEIAIEKKIVKIAILYILSALFYSKATAHNMTGYLYMKLLTLLKYNATDTCQMNDEGKIILKRAIRNISSSFKDICFEYQQDIDDILKETRSSNPNNEKTRTQTKASTYNKNSLLYSEAFESILAYHGVEVASIEATGAKDFEEKIVQIYEKLFDTAKYDIYGNIYNRIKLLKFKSEMNYRLLRAIAARNKFIENTNFKFAQESYYQSGLKNLINQLLDTKEHKEQNIDKQLEEEMNKLNNKYYGIYKESLRKGGEFKNSRRKKIETRVNFNKEKKKWEEDKRLLNTKIKQWEEDKAKINFLVRDSLFNLNEVLKFVQIYGETFLLTNLFVADTYDKAICWLQLKQWTVNEGISNKESDILLNRLIGERYYKEFQECWNWANARRFYYKAEETHNEGRTYKDMINRGCFLNDEFSDQRLHFITAQERQKINQNDFKEMLRNLKNDKAEKYYDNFYLKHN